MTRTSLRRVGFAASALLISLAATLGLSAPAQAAADTLVITSPVNGDTTATRTVTVAGTGTAGASVALGDGAPATGTVPTVYGTVTVAADASWTFDIVFAADAPDTQVVEVVQVDATDTADPLAGDETVSFTLPAPTTDPAVGSILVTTPADSSTSPSRIIPFTGTAPVGSTLVLTLDDGTVQIPAPVVDGAGNFSATGLVPFTGADTRTFTVSGTDGSSNTLEPVDVTVTVPAALTAPVITTPLDGQTLATKQLTIAGTGVAGRNVVVLVLPADEASLSSLAMSDAMGNATPIVVASSGNWTTTVTIAPGNFVAVAIHTSAPSGSAPVEALSLPSNVVTFTIVPPVVVAELAATGTDPMNIAGFGGVLLLVGAAVLVSRRARLRVSSIQ